MSTTKKKAVATTRKAPARRRMSGKPARRSPRRRAMRGMSSKGIMDSVSDMAQVGGGMLLYGLGAKFAAKQWPTANPHLINAGAVAVGVLVGENMKSVRKVAIGFGGAAIGNSVLQLMPASLMQGHTGNRAALTDRQRKMIEDKLNDAARKARGEMSSALNGKDSTLNGRIEDYV